MWVVVRGQTGLLGFAGYKSSFRFSERPCLEDIEIGEVTENTGHLLWPLCIPQYTHPHTEKKNELLSSNLLPFASIHPGEGPQ